MGFVAGLLAVCWFCFGFGYCYMIAFAFGLCVLCWLCGFTGCGACDVLLWL